MSKEHDKELRGAFNSLKDLIGQTRAHIEKHRERGDAKALADLIFQQRHNLKVLFRNLEKAKKGASK